jgi:hypothetical protein
VIRRATLLDCVAAVQANDADTFVATDLEGTHLLRRLGLTPFFTLLPRPLATSGIHAVVSRDHARAAELMAALNTGLKNLKEGDAYASIVQKHLIAAASAPVASGAPAQRKAPFSATQAPATKTAAAAAAPRAPAPAPTVTASTAPKVDPESRERALKFVKRGGEELAEGRVAPARLLFERAAEMGMAQAAMALAATYDAAELNQPHLRNVLPDLAEARRWYERAHALGAAEAGVRLQRLGTK